MTIVPHEEQISAVLDVLITRGWRPPMYPESSTASERAFWEADVRSALMAASPVDVTRPNAGIGMRTLARVQAEARRRKDSDSRG